jgi:flagellar biosynthesis/type III secretory pathway protein FliH
MSIFVPIRTDSGFRAGVVAGAEQPTKAVPGGNDVLVAGDVAVGEAPEGTILPATEAELQELLEQALIKGREAAELALSDTRLEVEAERARLNQLRDTIDASRAKWAEDVRSVLGEVVMVGVRSVISESVTLQEQLLNDRFAEVGERLIGEQNVLVRVRPEDADAARALVGDRPGWKVVPDPDLSGGVVAETGGGKVDASLGSALAGLAESVQDWQAEGMGEE